MNKIVAREKVRFPKLSNKNRYEMTVTALQKILTPLFLGWLSFFQPVEGYTQIVETNMLIATPWHEYEGGRVRIGLQTIWQNGRREGIIEANLKPNWKTYWQNPGNSGMAPTLLFDQKVNYEIMFPVPQLFQDGSDWSIGYKNSVILPFSVEKTENGTEPSGHLMIGLCNEICVPLDIPFDFSNIRDNENIPGFLLTQAISTLPQKLPSDSSIKASNDEEYLTVIITHPKESELSALYLDGGINEIGPATIISQNQNETIFNAKIIAANSTKPLEIHYIAQAKPISFSGTIVSVAKK